MPMALKKSLDSKDLIVIVRVWYGDDDILLVKVFMWH